MNTISQPSYINNSGVSNAAAQALTGGGKAPVTIQVGAVSSPTMVIAPDGSVTVTVNAKDYAAIRSTAQDLDIPLVGIPAEIDGASLQRLVEATGATPAGAPLAAALDSAMDAAVAQFALDYPSLYLDMLHEFNKLQIDRPMSLFDLLALLAEKGLECTISMTKIGGATKAKGVQMAIELKIKEFKNKVDLAKTTLSEGMSRVGFTAASGVAGTLVSGGALGVGAKTGALKSAAQEGKGLIGQSGEALKGPNAFGGAADPVANVGQGQAAGLPQALNKKLNFAKALSDNSYGISQGTSGSLNAGSTYSEVKTQVANAESQGTTSENEAETAANEATKTGAESMLEAAIQTAAKILSGYEQASSNTAATNKEVIA